MKGVLNNPTALAVGQKSVSSSSGLFSFRLFAHFSRKVASWSSLLQRKVLKRKSQFSEN